MGSRRTHEDRLARLREAGLTDDELARLSLARSASTSAPAPPRRPRSSIAAEIIARRWGGAGERLGRHRGAASTTTIPPTTARSGTDEGPGVGTSWSPVEG